MRTILGLAFILSCSAAAWTQDRFVRMTNQDWDRIEQEIDAVKPGDDVSGIKDKIARAWQKFEKIGNKGTAEAKACQERGKALEKKLDDKVKSGNSAVKDAGDVDAQLKLLEKHFPNGTIEPPELKEPYTGARLSEYVAHIKELRDVHKNGLEYLKKIQGTGVRNDDKFKYFVRQFEKYIPEKLDKGVEESLLSCDNIIRMYISIEVTDDKTKEEKLVLSLTADLTRALITCEARSHMEEHLKGAKVEAHEKEMEKIRGELKKLEGKAEAALKNARLPKGLDKPELAKIAETALQEHKAEFAHLLVVEDKTSHGKIVWDSGAFHEVAWETFAVSVVEKKGEDLTVFFYSFNFYTKRQPNLVVNKWIVLPWKESYRYRILHENLGK